MDNELLSILRLLEKKIDNLAKEVGELRALQSARPKARVKKEKPPPATPEQIAAHRGDFSRLYNRWLQGQEIEVHDELEKLDIEELRRFSDSNNLNVTSKMSKQRMLELVAARFREKRQLHKQPIGRSESKE